MALRPGGAKIVFEIDFNRIPQVVEQVEARKHAIVEKAKERLRDSARSRVRVLTGATRDSIKVTDEGVEASEAAGFLEYGTRKMPAYPFLGPAVDEVQGEFGQLFGSLFTGI